MKLKRKWIGFLLILLSSVLLLVVTYPKPALSAFPPYGMVTKTATDLGNLIGRKITRPILITDEKTSPPNFADDIKKLKGDAGAYTVRAKKENGIWVEQPDGEKMDTCWIVWLSPFSNDQQDKSLLAHEVYHCFQNELIVAKELPDWLIEGSAQWAAEEYVGGTKISSPSWKEYLTNAKALFSRKYDAIGLYAHLKNNGVNVWKELDQLLKNTSNNSDILFKQLVSDVGDMFLTNWAAGLARLTKAGPDWDTTGPGITLDKREPTPIAISTSAPLSVEILPVNQALYDITLPDSKIIKFNIKGYGALRWDGGSSDVLKFSQSFAKSYCVAKTCQCKDGSSPSGVESAPSGKVLLAVTGTTQSTLVDVTVEENPCQKDKPGKSGGSSSPNSDSLSGGSSKTDSSGSTKTGTSYGDPHLITFDGFRYSFQTVGEFLLSQSQDSKFAVQTRQSQVSGQQLTLNTAVAMKVGSDRVAFYAQNAPNSNPSLLWVNGKPVELQNGILTLTDGVVQKRSDQQYVIQWKTGEQVTVRLSQVAKLTFLNVTASVSATQPGGYNGLLGNIDGNAANDLQTRAGKVIPAKSSYGQLTSALNNLLPTPIPLSQLETAFLDQLHREFGNSWRIRSSESLFDYGLGQSTETFSNPSFPQRYLTLSSLLPAQLRTAENVCRKAGVEASLLEGCIFDVGMTNQPGFAQAAAKALVQGEIDRTINRAVDQVRDKIPVPIPVKIPGFPF
ncbi:von Willebrand factor type D domain protein [Cylindrospermum stagnale PCC 7417]|uniref:von Willebrand factor type D domain protein n=1 Tax=Cylindrospermum stagnale PCC 7417 TaxID=56107 RepID=K9WWF5_9NOST|nr:VWD domain-containing protein [Cylindrospermum stagnale]AFZ24106.1 von Willebrand factor type D domain protein [Cylindrospermum stagnale PCC 7417]